MVQNTEKGTKRQKEQYVMRTLEIKITISDRGTR